MKSKAALFFSTATTFVVMSSLQAATITKSSTGTDLTDGASWGGTAPGASDVAAWDPTSLGAGLTAATDVTWGSINVSGALTGIGITGVGSISTGDITLAGTRTLTIANPIVFSGDSIGTIADVTGSTAVDATLSGIVSGGFSLTKAGAGTLSLSNTANTYSGNTVINGGELQATVAVPAAGTFTTLGTGSVTANSGTTLRFLAGSTANQYTYTNPISLNNATLVFQDGTHILSGGIALTGANTFTGIWGGKNLIISGAITGTGSINKNITVGGDAVLLLQGANTYDGGTTVSGGTLNLNFSGATAPTSDILLSTGSVTLAGGTLSVTGKAATTNTQTLGGLSLAANSGSTLSVTPGSGGTATLDLGAITRNANAFINIVSSGTVTTTTGTASTILTDPLTGTPYATFGGSDWAAKNATNTSIVGLSTLGGYTPFTTGTVTLSGAADLTSGVAGTYTLGAASNTTLIRNTAITGNTIALAGFTLTTGAYLSNVTTTISGAGGFTAAVPGGDLLLTQTANTTTIVGNLTDNVGSSVTKAGTGTIAVSGTQSYTGVTTVAQGTFQMGSTTGQNGAAATLATSGIIVSPGATFNLGAGTLSATQNITGGGNFTKGGNFLTSGAINGTNNNYTGTTSVNVNTLTVGAGAVINGTSAISIATNNNAVLSNNGSITTPGALTMGGGNATSGIFNNNSTGIFNSGSISMSVGSSANNSGTITNTGNFTANGTFTSSGTLTTGALTVGGLFTLSAGSAFTDTAGTLVINNGGAVVFGNSSHLTSIATNGITINAGGSFSAPGTISSLLASGKILSTSAGAVSFPGDSSEAVDLTGFNSLALGAAGPAIYSGTITPVAGGYRFGGGPTSNLIITSPLSGANTLSQSGAGRTTLATGNTYSGTTTVTGGTLAIGNTGSINGGAVNITGGILAVIGGGTLNATSGGSVSIGAGNLVTTSVNNIGAAGSTIALTGAGVTGLQYVGAGETTDRIIGFNTASAGGFVTASGSGLLTFSNPATTTATGAFGVTFTGQGAGSFVGITQPATTQLINFNKQGIGSWTLTGLSNLKAGAFRADGGVLNFAATATTGSGSGIAATITRNAANAGILTIASGASVITSTGNTNGILGGWATFGGSTWAVTNGNAAPITGLATFTNNWLTATGNADITASNTSGALTVNSLRFNTPASITQTLSGANVITSGGILVTPAVGPNNIIITGGTSLAGGTATADLIIHQNNFVGGLTISSPITGTTAVTKAGVGLLTFNTQKTYTGVTNVLAGVLDLTGGGGLAGTIRGTANVATGATLRLSTGDATGYATDTTRLSTINLLGGTLDINTTSNQTLGSAVVNMTGASITGIANSNLDFFAGASALNTLASGTVSTISGVALSPTRQGNTTFTIAQGYTTSGIDLDIQSTLQNGATNAVLTKAGTGTLAVSGNNTMVTSSWLVSGGTLMVGNGGTTGSLGIMRVINNSRLAFNRSDTTGTFSNLISGTGAVAQIGSGKTTLTGSNTYTGPTTVFAGTLAGVGSPDSTLTVNSGGTLAPGDGIGFFYANDATFASGSTLAVEINSTAGTADTLIVDGSISLNNATATFTDLGATDFTVGTTLTLIEYFAGSLTGTFAGLPQGATVTVGSTQFTINYTDDSKVTLTATGVVTGYAAYAATNFDDQTAEEDFDNDGVKNGVEYFLNSPAGFTATPTLDGSNTITYLNGGNIPSSAYGTQFLFQTSSDLATWTDVPLGSVTNTTGSVSYTLTGSGPRFVRFKVVPN